MTHDSRDQKPSTTKSMLVVESVSSCFLNDFVSAKMRQLGYHDQFADCPRVEPPVRGVALLLNDFAEQFVAFPISPLCRLRHELEVVLHQCIDELLFLHCFVDGNVRNKTAFAAHCVQVLEAVDLRVKEFEVFEQSAKALTETGLVQGHFLEIVRQHKQVGTTKPQSNSLRVALPPLTYMFLFLFFVQFEFVYNQYAFAKRSVFVY